MVRRQVQDATALRTIVTCLERFLAGGELSPFAADVVVTLNAEWTAGMNDRLRLSAHDPVARAAQATGLFRWGRGERFKTLRSRKRLGSVGRE